MRLLTELLSHGYKIDIKSKEAETELGRRHAVCGRNKLLVRLTTPEGKWFEKYLWLHQELNLEVIAAELCAEHAEHFMQEPIYLAWKEQNGHIPTRVMQGVLLDELGRAIHSSLRKNVDTQNSAITWNAIHSLSKADLASLWEACARSLRALYEKDSQPTRMEAAKAFGAAVKEALSDCLYRLSLRDSTHTEVEALALRVLTMSVGMTTLEEWAWGWLGFIVEPLPLQVGSAVIKNTVA